MKKVLCEARPGNLAVGTSPSPKRVQDLTYYRYAQDNLGVKKVSAPSKNPAKCPRKKIISRTFKISGALIVNKS
jgi:hypothetical protein